MSAATTIHKPDYIPALDGLRGIAVLLVLWAHIMVDFIFPNDPPHTGALGVTIFFALSGFLITRILIADLQSGDTKRRIWWRFLRNRSSRIFPAFGLFLLVVGIFWPSREVLYASVYLLNYLLTAGEWAGAMPSPVRHAWSLCVEEHFYLLWPMVLLALPLAGGRLIALCGAVLTIPLALATEFAVGPEAAGIALGRWTHINMGAILWGCVLAYHEPWIRAHANRSLTLGLLFLIAAYAVPELMTHLPNELGELRYSMVFAWRALLAPGTVLLAIWCGWAPLRALLHDRRLRHVGRISYGLYLYHLPIYFVCRVWLGGGGNTANVALALTLTFAAAWTSYHYFELPIMRWARGTRPFFISPLPSRPTPAPAEDLTPAGR